MPSVISVRRAIGDDLPAILDVLRLALGEPAGLERTRHLWEWKHLDNPFGTSIVLLAEEGGDLAGVRAFMRWELTDPAGHRIRCVRAVDTATHPDHQRKGIFTTLTMAAVEEAAADGVDLIFNTPNPQSGAGYLKMGWSEVGGIPVSIGPSPRMLLPGRRPRPELVDAHEGPPPTMPVDRDALGMRTPRSPEYLVWRYGSHPTAVYRSVSAGDSAVIMRQNLRRGRDELVVSDLLGPRPAAVLREARRRSRADYMVGSFPAGSPERTAGVLAGLLPAPGLRALTLFARPLTDIGPVTDIAAWDIGLGDLELL